MENAPSFRPSRPPAAPPWASPDDEARVPAAHGKVALLICVMAWMGSLGTVVTGVALLMPTLMLYGSGPPTALLVLLASGAALSAGLFAVARSIRQQRAWARAGGIVCGSVLLFAFPLGTVAGGYMLWQLLFHWQAVEGDPARRAGRTRAD